MKRIAALMTAILMVLTLAACKKPSAKEKIDTNKETWVDCQTKAAAEQLAGFTFSFADVISDGNFQAASYRAVKDRMIETTYYAEDIDYTIVILQAKGEGKVISDDDSQYDYVETVKDCGTEMTLSYKESDVALTTFSYEGYSYVIYTYDLMGWQGIFEIISEMTGVQPNDQDTGEGAPIVEHGRLIDEKAIPVGDIAGRYVGMNYNECSVSIYTSMEEFAAEVGNVEITDSNNKIVFSGNLIQVMDNKYELQGQDVNFTVYTDNETINLDFYVNGKHADYFTMVEIYVS